MDSSTSIDCAVFQLSPRRSRCELLVTGNGKTEKLASGLLKPFVTHLKVAEEQAAQSVKVIKLEVERQHNGSPWFNKGTLERFVRFVSTPEILELVNTFDAEMSQLEGAQKIYSQGAGNSHSGAIGENEVNKIAADATKRELLKAIDVRLVALKQDLATACARASSAGFTLDNVSELLIFADYFGANRLNEACTKFISVCQRRPELTSYHEQLQSLPVQTKNSDDVNLRSSFNSDMSIDEQLVEPCSNDKVTNNSGSQVSSNLSMMPSSAQPSGTPQDSLSLLPCVVGKQVEKEVEEPSIAPSALTEPASGRNSRRLSVQDRINLFESKKVQSANSGNSSTAGTTNRVSSGKGEHRRLPSDFSEKLVLRRWSGASDMSIDHSSGNSVSFNDRKEIDSVGTPTVSSQIQSTSGTEGMETCGLEDSATSHSWVGSQGDTFVTSTLFIPQVLVKSFPRNRDQSEEESQVIPAIERKQENDQITSSMIRRDAHELADQYASQIRPKSVYGDGGGSSDHAVSSIQSKNEDHVVEEEADLPTIIQDGLSLSKHVGLGKQEGFQLQTREIASQSGNVALKEKTTVVSQFQTFGRKNEEVKTKGHSVNFVMKSATGLSSDSDSYNISQEIFGGAGDGARERDSTALSHRSLLSVKQGTNIQRQLPALDSVKKVHEKREERLHAKKIGNPIIPVRKVTDNAEIVDSPSDGLVDQVLAVKPLKGNQELNDELQIKANELEKLFAAHKLRILSDQTPSSRRNKPIQEKNIAEVPREGLHREKESDNRLSMELMKNEDEFDQTVSSDILDNNLYSSNMNQKLSKYDSDDIRGRFYENYMQKRDAKLREEWGPKRALKEAKTKALKDSLDNIQAEMKEKFTHSTGRREPIYSSRRAERLKSLSRRLSLICKDQAVELVEEEEEDSGTYGQGNDGQFGDGSSRSQDSKKIESEKALSSTRSSVATIPKPSFRPNSNSVKQRTRTENSLAESVPNFSDLRKENKKPLASTNKANTRIQKRSFSRSKSIIEETNLVKEDKPRRTQSMRKSTGCPSELRDLSTLAMDCGTLTSFGFLREQADITSASKGQKSGDPKPFLRKGSGIGAGSGASSAKLRASIASEIIKTEDASEDTMHQQQVSHDLAKDEEDDSSVEGDTGVVDLPVDSDSEMVGKSTEFENSDDLGSENGGLQGKSDTAPIFNFDSNVGKLQESPVESLWNSCLRYPFSYEHEVSEFDASVDSPLGSPASWNSHRLRQIVEADASRMRKKWGSAQMPVIVSNATQHQHKDVSKGFKRLLKFGRKTRGIDSVATDSVSASTASEGDDDTDDGRDLLRPSHELKTSRMGFPLPPYDATHNVENLPEQADSLRSSIPNPPANFKLREEHLTGSSLKAPRSFFSLSSFRTKGSESKFR